MTEEKFDPVKGFVSLRDSITKAVGQSLKSIAGIEPEFPAMDIYETKEAVVVCTEPLLGIKSSSIEVSMEDGVLTIGGETNSDINIPDATYLLRELRFGKFSRTIPISRKVNPDQAKASLVQGTLTIELPKATEETA